MRRVQITDESYGYLQDMNVGIDRIIKATYLLMLEHAKEDVVPEDKDVAVRILHLSITKRELEKLQSKYRQESIDEVFDAMRNCSYLKKYKNGYLTANNWLSKRGKEALLGNGAFLQVGSKEWMEKNG